MVTKSYYFLGVVFESGTTLRYSTMFAGAGLALQLSTDEAEVARAAGTRLAELAGKLL